MKKVVFDAEVLRVSRQKRGMSRAELAELLGVKEVTCYYWEQEIVKEPQETNVKKMASIFNIKVTDFYKVIEIEEEKKEKKIFNGAVLKTLREQNGWTQAEVASKIGIKGGCFTISKWESGAKGCKKKNVILLAKLFGCNPEEFYKEGE